MDKLEKLNKLMELMANDTITPKELEQFLTLVLGVIKQSKDHFEVLSKANLKKIDEAMSHIESFSKGEFDKKIAEVRAIVATVPKDGKDGKDAVVDTTKLASEASKHALEAIKPLIPTIEAIEEDLPKLGVLIRDGLELLTGDDRLDFTAIKGLDTEKLSTNIINRAISIVDNRTSFLINKVSDLKTQVDNIDTGGGVTDGDKGDITVTASGATWTIDNDTIGLDELSATGTPSATTFLRGDNSWATPAGSGDVVGPASSTDNAIARFDTTTGKLIQNSVVTIADTTGNMAGVGTLNTHTIPGGTGTIALTSDLHNAVTIGTANGLSLATQALSLAVATTSVAGAMSAADKTKLDGVATSANNYSHPNHSGDVTSVADGAQTIANSAVTNAKMANMTTKTYKGRTAGTTGAPEDVAVATLKTDLGLVKGDVGLGNVDNTSDATLVASIKDGGSAEIDAAEFGAGASTDGQVLTSDGLGGAAWEAAAGGGLANVVEDLTPQLGGALDGQGFDLNNMGVLFLTEQAAAEVDVAGKGQFWVKTATPNEPWFTDDVGTDFQLNLFTSTLLTKLNGIEALADVTDTTNVTAAGALMDSEVDADIKTLVLPASTTITTAAATVLDDATVSAMVDTLGGASATGTGGLVRTTSPSLVTPALGTPASGVMTNVTGLPISALVAGTLATNLTLGENTSIDLDPAGSADGKYSGICITGTAGAALTFGQLIYLAVADSRWELADADAATTSDRMLGMCVLAAAGDGSATKILLMGQIRADAQFPALTIGSAVYVGETAGAIQVAIPTGADNVIRRVGYALTADELYFCPSMDSQTSVA